MCLKKKLCLTNQKPHRTSLVETGQAEKIEGRNKKAKSLQPQLVISSKVKIIVSLAQKFLAK